jgi:hypothetical protein
MGKTFRKVVTLKNCLEMRERWILEELFVKKEILEPTQDGLIGLSRTAVLGVTSA